MERVEEERKAKIYSGRGGKMKGVGVADERAIEEKELGRQRDTVERIRVAEQNSREETVAPTDRKIVRKRKMSRKTSVFLPPGVTVKSGSVE